jgi:peptidyl-prolyl cis-trans isomerase C
MKKEKWGPVVKPIGRFFIMFTSPIAAQYKQFQMPNLKALLVMMGLVMTLAACGEKRQEEVKPEPGDVAVAKVNNVTIWASDVRQEAVALGEIGEGEPLDMTSDLFRRTLEDVIDRRLMADEAKSKKLDASVLAQRRLKAAQDRILADMLVENAVNRAVDEKKVKELYEEQVRLAQKSEEINARLIVVKTRDDALAVLKDLQGGAIFEALAMERSIDQSTRFNGGEMGYFTADIMPAAFKAPLSQAAIGALVGPVETDGGWAILRVEDRRPEKPLTLEESRPQIVRFLTFDQLRILLTKLRTNAKVSYLTNNSGQAPVPSEPIPDIAPETAPKLDDQASASVSSASMSAKPS